MRPLGNLLWFLFGGLYMGLGWGLAGLLMYISIVGIPFGIQHVKITALTLSPIGKTVVRSEGADAARRS